MPTMQSIREHLMMPVEQSAIKRLPEAAGGHAYIPWQYAYERLREATAGNWHYEIMSATVQGQYAVVCLRLFISADDGLMTQDELASVSMDSRAPAFEVATRSAVKRAASVFGLADNLWQGHDHGQDFDHYSQQPRQPQEQQGQSSGIVDRDRLRTMPPTISPEEMGGPRMPDGPPYDDGGTFPEGFCSVCGREVKRGADGNYYRKCYECNQRRG